jgi:Predicted AAA-ATPase
MIKIPYGRADFAAMRRENCFYIDRTNYIEQLETYASSYTMFLRPRRFGKSLFLSILEEYYDVNKTEQFQKNFGDLYIGKQPTTLANQFLIMPFDFSGIETNDIQQTHPSFLLKVKDGFSTLMSANAGFFTDEQERFILNQPLASSMAVEFFSAYRKNKIQRPIYVLIDEYDHFTNELLSFHFHDFKDIVSKNGYLRKFYEVLKTEAKRGSIGRIFMTGVAPVTVDSMTSGFNIVTDVSLHPFFHDMMGFTEPEVADLLLKIGVNAVEMPLILDDLRVWYDGYRFDRETARHLYNPEMVLYFTHYYQSVRKYPLKMLTSNIATDYKKIANIFRIGGNEDLALKHLNYLLENGTVNSYVTDKFNVELGFGITEIWSMLFYTGMTTVKAIEGNNWTFQMPNYVIKNLYYDYFVALHLGTAYGRFRHEIREAIEKLLAFGEITDFVRLVGEVLTEHSNRDKIAYGEKHLKTLMIGLLVPYESYWIRSEPESKGKYVDIFLERIPQVNIKHEIVLELKYIKKEDGLKWVDNQGNIVNPPASAKPLVATPAKKGRKPKVQPVVALVPTTPANPPVKSLLEHVSAEGAVQLAGYMESSYFQRPNILGFCLVFVGNECHKILPYQRSAS